MRSLDRGQGIEEFKLRQQIGLNCFRRRQTFQTHQRGIADGSDKIIKYSAPSRPLLSFDGGDRPLLHLLQGCWLLNIEIRITLVGALDTGGAGTLTEVFQADVFKPA